MGQSVIVNKVAYDFYCLEISLFAGPTILSIIDGVEEIEYTTKIARTKLYGSSRVPQVRTDGDAEPDASLSMWAAHWNAIRAFLKASGIPIALAKFTAAITYNKTGVPIVTDTLWEAAFAEIQRSAQRGTEGLMVKSPLDVMNIFYDGEDVFGNRLA